MRRSSIFSSWAEHALRRNSLRKIGAGDEVAEESPRSSPRKTVTAEDEKSRRESSFSLSPLTIASTIVFVDLEGYSKQDDLHQKHITSDFMTTLRDLLTFAYRSVPDRSQIDDYVILPTGDGAAVCVMRPPRCTCDSSFLQGTQETALWIGASLLLWASKRKVGLRVGLNSGDLTIVEDPYGDANVCGNAINLASRIMDTATPGQVLACSESVVSKLKTSHEKIRCNCHQCLDMCIDISPEPIEVVVKHGVTTHVQSIMCTLSFPLREVRQSLDILDHDTSMEARASICQELERLSSNTDETPPDWKEMSFASLSSSYTKQYINLSTRKDEPPKPASRPPISSTSTASKQSTCVPLTVGSHNIPQTKWYMKIKPTEMKADANNIKPKLLPLELIRRHTRIAFIGITHDCLHKVFKEALETDPNMTWDQVYIFYPTDGCLHAIAPNLGQTGDELVNLKNTNKQSLLEKLSNAVNDLRFLELNQLMHCGSYWDWKDRGGYIHISPLTWGANPKTCPAMNYYWNSTDPSPEYRVYRDGLEYLLNIATPFAEKCKLLN